MLRHDLRIAVRSLVRRPGFSLVAVGTLALGMGATTAIFGVVNDVLLRPLPYADSERIVAIWERSTEEPRDVRLGLVAVPDFEDWNAGTTSFEAMALFRNRNVTLSLESGAELVPGADATADFFRVFGAEPVLGRTFTPEETRYRGPQVAVIGYGFWQERLGGRADVIGSTLRLQGTSYTIVGVAPHGFDFPRGARIWLPVQNNDEGCGRGCVLYSGIALLRSDVAASQARAELEAISTRLAAEYPEQNVNTIGDLATLHEVTVGDVRLALFVVFGAVLMVLLIACANVANLMLVRGTARRVEMAVRAALGAGRRTLVRQLLTESTVLAVTGTGLGLLLAAWGIDVLRDLAPGNLPRVEDIGLSARALGFAVLLALFTVTVFGIVPALRISELPFAQTLREGGRGATGSRFGARSFILAAEVALSVVLLLGAGLMLRSLFEMRAVEPGFQTDNIAHFSISLPSARYPEPEAELRFVEMVLDRLNALPGVERAGFVVGLPLGTTNIFGGFTRTDLPQPDPGQVPEAAYRAIDPDFLAAMGIPLLAGRSFTSGDRMDAESVALIDQALADRYFAGEDPLGKQIDVQVSIGFPDTLPRTIVGVVGNVRARSLTELPEPSLYVPEAQAAGGFGAFVIRAAGGAAILRAARGAVASVDPEIPLNRPGTMAELVADDTARHSFILTLLGLFALLAVTLAAVGMYGVVAFVVAQRTREIGVRMALGARAREVVSLVVWQGLRPALTGAALGIAGALAAGRIIESLLFGVAAQDPLTMLTVALVLLGVVALACTVPARRATRIPPASALRAE